MPRNSEPTTPVVGKPVPIGIDGVALSGELDVPAPATGVILFPHVGIGDRGGSLITRIAASMQDAGLGTLRCNLLTPEEENADARDGSLPFDLDFLQDRLHATTQWARAELGEHRHALGCFATGTTAAAALRTVAREPEFFRGIVSCGGRPDMAGPELDEVTVPTLLVAAGRNEPILELTRAAYRHLRCEKRLLIVPTAARLSEDTEAGSQISPVASAWFLRHFAAMQTEPQTLRSRDGKPQRSGSSEPR